VENIRARIQCNELVLANQQDTVMVKKWLWATVMKDSNVNQQHDSGNLVLNRTKNLNIITHVNFFSNDYSSKHKFFKQNGWNDTHRVISFVIWYHNTQASNRKTDRAKLQHFNVNKLEYWENRENCVPNVICQIVCYTEQTSSPLSLWWCYFTYCWKDPLAWHLM